MHTDEANTRPSRRGLRDIEGVLIPVAVGCAVLTGNLNVYTAAWWAALTVTILACLAEVVVASSRTHGYSRLDDFLYGQSSSVSYATLVAFMVFWHHPHASCWGVPFAGVCASALATACYFVAARVRRRRPREP